MPDTETMAAFGASEAACYHWPSDAEGDRQCREAFCMGAGWSAKEIDRLRAEVETLRNFLVSIRSHSELALNK